MNIPTTILSGNLSSPWKQGSMNSEFLDRKGATAFYAAARKCLAVGGVHHSKQSYWKQTPQFCTLFNPQMKLEKVEERQAGTHAPLLLSKPMLEAAYVDKKKGASLVF